MTRWKSHEVHGHPWLRMSGIGFGPLPRARKTW